GRNMPWWLVGASIVGTSLSSIAFLVVPGIGFTLDFSVITGEILDTMVAGLITCIFFVSFLRKTSDASIYTLLGNRFGRGISLYMSAAFIVYKVLYAGIILSLVGKSLHFITGASVESIILISGLLVVFYTYMTGIEGVMWTDFFQTVLLAIAGVLALMFVGEHLLSAFDAGGLDYWEASKEILSQGTQDDIFLSESVGITLVFFITRSMALLISDQTIGQRYLVARSDRDAKQGLLLASLGVPAIAGVFLLIGMCLYVLYKVSPQLATPEILADPDGVFAYFIANNMPNGLLGIIIIGILAAAMSTIDTGINSSSTVFYCNFYEPFSGRLGSKVLQNMSVMRNCSLIFGCAAILAAYLIFKHASSTLSVFWKGGALILNGALGLFILMRVSKRAGKKSGITALVMGMAFITWATFTSKLDHPLAAPFHYMWGLPVGTSLMVVVGVIASRFLEDGVHSVSGPLIHGEEARRSIARKRRRAKKNIFADSLRPKNFYQVYAGIALAVVLLLIYDRQHMGLGAIPQNLLFLSAVALLLVIIGPYAISNFTSKRYLALNLGLLATALPLVTAVVLFLHPEDSRFGSLFLASVAGLGTMVGWTMLSLSTMLSVSVASVVALYLSPEATVPENWVLLSLGTFGIFVFYAMDAAKARSAEERTFEKVHTILKRVSDLTMSHSIDLSQSGRQLNMQDVGRLTHAASDIATAIDALTGATDIDPEDGQLELSVEESLNQVLNRVPLKRGCIEVFCERDFKVLGNRDVFENILYHLVDNAVYYLERGQATQVVCLIDAENRTFSISNNGPAVKPADVPFVFDLGYTTKDSLGLGLAYCKKMLEGMRGGIRLISKPNDSWVAFKIYFPFSYDGRKLDDDVRCQNDVQL
ncbi:MAG TPA: hypothetical protein DIU37_02260, partial [Opitutae bacterium]|nr:hypothetical protein [Opitutae bacterium]